MKLIVFRYDGSAKDPYYDQFDIDPDPGMTVLGALFHIRDELDDSLSFRYSCRGAVCGNCSMLINKVPNLACRTQLRDLLASEDQMGLKPYAGLESKANWVRGKDILVEPLPHLPVLKDLVVDMTGFFQHYSILSPVLRLADTTLTSELPMSREQFEVLEKFTNCILCACCFGACPVNGQKMDYHGPAALAKLYRFYLDPREPDHESRLFAANSISGWWGCEFHANCKRVCPKGVPPNLGIGRARQTLKKLGRVPKEAIGEK